MIPSIFMRLLYTMFLNKYSNNYRHFKLYKCTILKDNYFVHVLKDTDSFEQKFNGITVIYYFSYAEQIHSGNFIKGYMFILLKIIKPYIRF